MHHGMRKGSLLKHGVVNLVKHGVQGVVNSVRVLDCGAGIEFMRDDRMTS